MNGPEHTSSEAEQFIKEVWWHSKTFVGSLFAHLLVASGSVAGLLMDHHSAATIVPAQLASHVAIHTGVAVKGAAVERAQAYSPNYPSNGVYPPQPPAPVTIIQPAGGAVTTPFTPATVPAPTPPAGPNSGMNL